MSVKQFLVSKGGKLVYWAFGQLKENRSQKNNHSQNVQNASAYVKFTERTNLIIKLPSEVFHICLGNNTTG